MRAMRESMSSIHSTGNDGEDFVRLMLPHHQAAISSRRAELERSVHESDELILSRRLPANGLEAFRAAKQRGYEGLVTKRLASVYVEGRSREWLKVKVNQEDEFIIVGYTELWVIPSRPVLENILALSSPVHEVG
jgi:bifunctional non-homologous end joining protein LigD